MRSSSHWLSNDNVHLFLRCSMGRTSVRSLTKSCLLFIYFFKQFFTEALLLTFCVLAPPLKNWVNDVWYFWQDCWVKFVRILKGHFVNSLFMKSDLLIGKSQVSQEIFVDEILEINFVFSFFNQILILLLQFWLDRRFIRTNCQNCL